MGNNFIHSPPFAPSTVGKSTHTSSPSLPPQIDNGLGPILSEDTPKPASLNLSTYLSPVLGSTYAVSRWRILLTIPPSKITLPLGQFFCSHPTMASVSERVKRRTTRLLDPHSFPQFGARSPANGPNGIFPTAKIFYGISDPRSTPRKTLYTAENDTMPQDTTGNDSKA